MTLRLVQNFVESGLEVVKLTMDGVEFSLNLVGEGFNLGMD